MKHSLSPLLADLQSESVLYQAWKKTAAFIRSHNWYADNPTHRASLRCALRREAIEHLA